MYMYVFLHIHMYVYICAYTFLDSYSLNRIRRDNCVIYLILDQYIFWDDKMELTGCDGTNL